MIYYLLGLTNLYIKIHKLNDTRSISLKIKIFVDDLTFIQSNYQALDKSGGSPYFLTSNLPEVTSNWILIVAAYKI